MIAGLLTRRPQLAVTVGELPFGKGKILICSMNLLPYLDKDPVADRDPGANAELRREFIGISPRCAGEVKKYLRTGAWPLPPT